MVKNMPNDTGDRTCAGSIPGSGRSSGGGHGNPLQYSCLESPMDRGPWRAMVHGVVKSRTRLKQLSSNIFSDENLKSFPLRSGTRQGCPLSPLLLSTKFPSHVPAHPQGSSPESLGGSQSLESKGAKAQDSGAVTRPGLSRVQLAALPLSFQ